MRERFCPQREVPVLLHELALVNKGRHFGDEEKNFVEWQRRLAESDDKLTDLEKQLAEAKSVAEQNQDEAAQLRAGAEARITAE